MSDKTKCPDFTERAISTGVKAVRSTLDLDLQIVEASHAGFLDLDSPLRVYINLEQQDVAEFYDFLASSITGFVVTNELGECLASRDADAVRVAGFDDAESMLAAENERDLSTSMLEDYFAFPSKFLFFYIHGLKNIYLGEATDGGRDLFSISLQFNSTFPSALRLEPQSLKLNCVPVVNLFERACDPVIVTEKEYRYPVVVNRGSRWRP